MNVFKFGYYPKRFIFKNIKQFFTNCSYAYQRATKGYCDRDIWNLDSFYLTLFNKTLKELSENTNCYPAHYTYEEWVAKLKEISDLAKNIESASDNYDFPDNKEVEKLFFWLKENIFDLWD